MNHLFKPTRDFPIVNKTDRDVENVVVKEWVENIKPQSLLDVGAHYSHQSYALSIRPFIDQYDGIDILECAETADVLDNYIVGNANEAELTPYEAVMCISTLEHAGLSTYQGDHVEEMMSLFKTCISHAEKYALFTFPVGLEYTYPGQLSLITKDHLRRFKMIAKGWSIRERFFLSQGPQAGHPWQEHDDRDLALSISYVSTWGNRSICALELSR